MNAKWFIKNGERVIGPITFEQLKKRASNFEVTPFTYIRHTRGDWSYAAKVEGLFNHCNGTKSPQTSAAPISVKEKQTCLKCGWTSVVPDWMSRNGCCPFCHYHQSPDQTEYCETKSGSQGVSRSLKLFALLCVPLILLLLTIPLYLQPSTNTNSRATQRQHNPLGDFYSNKQEEYNAIRQRLAEVDGYSSSSQAYHNATERIMEFKRTGR